MAVTVEASGTQAATIGTEHTLWDSSSAASYQFGFDSVNMAAGDIVEIRIYRMFKTGGTRRVTYFMPYYDAQVTDDVGKVFIPVSTGLTDSGAIRATLKQTAGTGRNFDWEVLKFS
jgi:hypothetical protein